ncbi:MAG: galactose mutarotase [Melioribacteraceae bacterium]|nr:galactose mutarotase [Melioribacteraceae bacterium]MCF8264981.1 galactose mutarotase [Melioribacteraceae bacterium]MCF8431634.1 galactose mutarotase [Melioribacteraceae bacterium]
MTVEEFGTLRNGNIAHLITLKNSNGVEVKLTNLGAAVVSISVPNKENKFEDVVLGYDSLSGYEIDAYCLGCITGRFANRIKAGKFELDGHVYQLACNNGNNHLHGGLSGFNRKLWKIADQKFNTSESVTFLLTSEDGDQNYPGKVELSVNYLLTENNSVEIHYSATTNKPTILNPTNHTYFNLSGDFTRQIVDHLIRIDADFFTPTDNESIPTGEILKVDNTPMDLRDFVKIGDGIDEDFNQLKYARGYDQNWVLRNYDKRIKEVAEVYHQNSGRFLKTYTNQPGLQFYTGNSLNGRAKGKNEIPVNTRTGFCLEAQFYPDSPNHSHFPQPVLRPGEKYTQTTVYQFGVRSTSN